MSDLIDSVVANYDNFDFFKAVSLLEKQSDFFSENNSTETSIHFVSDNSTSFPPNDISRIDFSERNITINLSFMSLTGISSPLPNYFSDFLYRFPDKMSGLNDFLTIFNHRIYTLFYLAWKKYNTTNLFTESEKVNLLSVITLLAGMNSLGPASKPSQILKYCKDFIYSKSAASLVNILSDFFEGIPIHLEEFVLRRVTISNIKSLGNDYILGKTSVLGTDLNDRTGKFRIIAGPVSYEFYRKLLTKNFDFRSLFIIIDTFAELIDYELIFLMKRKDLIPINIGTEMVGLGKASSLGSSTIFDNESTVQVLSIDKTSYTSKF